jgi:hypothetical protein
VNVGGASSGIPHSQKLCHLLHVIEYTPSDSSFVFTTHNKPPVLAAKQATRLSNSALKSESNSEGRAPMIGGSRERRYKQNIPGSNTTVGSADATS